MVSRLVIILLALFLIACDQPQPFVAGEATLAPQGWIEYCQRNPLDHDCQNKN